MTDQKVRELEDLERTSEKCPHLECEGGCGDSEKDEKARYLTLKEKACQRAKDKALETWASSS